MGGFILTDENLCEDRGWLLLQQNIKKLAEVAKNNRQDLPILITGQEGSGKSTLAYHIAKILDPNFNIHESIIFDFKESENSFKRFMEKFSNTPYKVAFLDEAVTVLFSQTHASKENKDAQLLYKIKRDCRHFDLLVTPSFWDVVPDIRERRSKVLIITYIDIITRNGKSYFNHKFAWYGRKKITEIVTNYKTKRSFGTPEKLFQLVPPNFIGNFPKLKKEDEKEYLKIKQDHKEYVLRRIFGDPKEAKEPTLEPLDFSNFDNILKEYIQ